MWFSTNFKLATEAGRARCVTAKGNIASTDIESEGQTYTEWQFARPGGASSPYADTFKPVEPETVNAPIALPQPLFFGSKQSCTACTASSSSTAAPLP